MIPFFPQQISLRAIGVYLLSLALVTIVFFDNAMDWLHIALGLVFVSVFFGLVSSWSGSWKKTQERQYVSYIFWIAVVLRVVWVVASFYYYTEVTGVPFEVDAADSIGYHHEAAWLAS